MSASPQAQNALPNEPSAELQLDEPEPNSGRELSYWQVLLASAAIGLLGGGLASAFYYWLEATMHWVWQVLPSLLGSYFPNMTPASETAETQYGVFLEPYFPGGVPSSAYVWLVATVGGLLVGLSLYWLGRPGEVNSIVDDVHQPGQIDPRQSPSMFVTATCSITAGGSLGPEAPLVQMIGSLGSWLGGKLQLAQGSIRLLTLCGMSAALSAFFGAPVGGALFALELPHRRGLEFYEALGPAIVAGIMSFVTFRGLAGMTASGLYAFPELPELTVAHLGKGALLGAIGASAAFLFSLIFRGVGHLSSYIAHQPILLASLGGLAIGTIGFALPQTLFFSEMEVQSIIVETGASLGMEMLFVIALAKMVAIACTVHAGFRGGFIFPLFFIGAAIGLALALATPHLHPTIAMLCTMAAVNVAVTKTPIATSVILCALSDVAAIPAIAIASFASFVLTANLSVIRTQRPRSVVIERPQPASSLNGMACPQVLYANELK